MRQGRLRRACVALWAIAAATACDGIIADPGSRPGTGSAPDGSDGAGGPGRSTPALTCDEAPEPGRTPIRVLSETEYENTMRDLLGTDAIELTVPPGTGAYAFDNDALDLSTPPNVLESFVQAATEAASIVRAQLDARLECDRLEGRPCAERFLRTFARRAYRRTPTDAEIGELLTLYDLGGTFDEGLELAVQGVLVAAPFLYHVQVGIPESEGRVRLDGFELASRLSYFLWASMPDDALLDAAERGDLDTPEGLAAEAGRLLDDPRARKSVSHLHAQWLELERIDGAERDPALHAGFDAALREDLKRETLRFLEELVFGGGRVGDILDADFTMMNGRVAAHYGVEGVTGDEFQRVPLDPDRRAGVLTHASLLAARATYDRTSPIRRGVFVRTQILCQELPTPPNDIPLLPEPEPEETERERLARHASDPVCASCHQLIDPLGFPFERYDAVGRWRETDHDGGPIDSSGAVTLTSDADGPVEDALELSRRLAGSAEAERCVVEQWVRYALARSHAADRCIVDRLHAELGPGFALRDLALAIVTSEAFRLRDSLEPSTPTCE